MVCGGVEAKHTSRKTQYCWDWVVSGKIVNHLNIPEAAAKAAATGGKHPHPADGGSTRAAAARRPAWGGTGGEHPHPADGGSTRATAARRPAWGGTGGEHPHPADGGSTRAAAARRSAWGGSGGEHPHPADGGSTRAAAARRSARGLRRVRRRAAPPRRWRQRKSSSRRSEMLGDGALGRAAAVCMAASIGDHEAGVPYRRGWVALE